MLAHHTLVFHTIKLGKKVNKALGKEAFPYSLGPTQASAILLISQNGQISQSEMAAHLHLEPASVVTLIDTLEKLHLVKRGPTDHDRRRYQITLTEPGIKSAKVIARHTEKLDKFLRSNLTPKETQVILELSDKIAGLLDNWKGGES